VDKWQLNLETSRPRDASIEGYHARTSRPRCDVAAGVLSLRGDHVRFGPGYYRPTIVAKPWPRALHEMLLLFQTKAEDLM
jgi:hypothetical protein